MYRTFIPGIAPPPVQSEPAWWFAFVGNKLLIQLEGTLSTIPNLISLGEIGLIPVRSQFLGTLDDKPFYSAELAKDAVIDFFAD